jgi:hypothetical protein
MYRSPAENVPGVRDHGSPTLKVESDLPISDASSFVKRPMGPRKKDFRASRTVLTLLPSWTGGVSPGESGFASA